ncbi:MAG: serine hydrolase domain-containing protein [Candidatus Acidiferrales bacterium]
MISCASCRTPSADLSSTQLSKIDRYVQAEMQREIIPGLSLGIYKNGDIVLAKGYGLANIELNVPVKPETVFQSGSVGKQFTAAAVMMLVEEGKIGLNDPISKYFPKAPQFWNAIRVKNLLSHTSGLSEYTSDERTGPAGPFYTRLDFTEDQFVEKIEALPMEFKPGDKWDYRNTNYLLLGAIIHKITGKPYIDFLEERIFKPLGMTSTRLINEAEIIPNRAAGYQLVEGVIENQNWVSPSFNTTADGALYFNVLDLAKWDGALYGTTLLTQSSLDRAWTVFLLNDGKPNWSNYGFGWEINQINGHKVIEHGGAWQGFRCHISRYVGDQTTVVVLTNSDSAATDVVTHVVAGLVNPALDPPKTVAIADEKPQVAERLRAALNQIDAGQPVTDQMTPSFAVETAAHAGSVGPRALNSIWPPDSVALVSRGNDEGVTESTYRFTRGAESRFVIFSVSKDGKIAALDLQPDPDMR